MRLRELFVKISCTALYFVQICVLVIIGHKTVASCKFSCLLRILSELSIYLTF